MLVYVDTIYQCNGVSVYVLLAVTTLTANTNLNGVDEDLWWAKCVERMNIRYCVRMYVCVCVGVRLPFSMEIDG